MKGVIHSTQSSAADSRTKKIAQDTSEQRLGRIAVIELCGEF